MNKMAEACIAVDWDQFSCPVWCDVCPSGTKPALKSCLRCLASYCEAHLKPHYDSPALRRHRLTEASRCLQEMICPLHKEPLSFYCRSDQQCICLLCVENMHRLHDTVSAEIERAESQKSLSTAQENSRKWIHEREKKLQDERRRIDSVRCAAQTAVADSERLFADIIQSVQTQRLKMNELILSEERAAVTHSEGLQKKLKQEITELKTKDAELQNLAQMKDHIRFLQRWKSLSTPPGDCALPCVTADPQLTFASVSRAVTELRERLVPLCQAEFEKMSEKVSRENNVVALPSRKRGTEAEHRVTAATLKVALQKLKSGETGSGCGHSVFKVQVVENSGSASEPRTRGDLSKSLKVQLMKSPLSLLEPWNRGDFLRYACALTLDPNTAHVKLLLSPGHREAKWVKDRQSYPKSSERFNYKCQVLSKEALSGRRYYWEATVKGSKLDIAVAYKGIERKGAGRASSFGGNDKSWSLDCINGVYSVCHNDSVTRLSVPCCSRVGVSCRLGVYLDHLAGKLSFYSVSDTMTLLHSEETVFTEPVYAGFWMGEQSSVKLEAFAYLPDVPTCSGWRE